MTQAIGEGMCQHDKHLAESQHYTHWLNYAFY